MKAQEIIEIQKRHIKEMNDLMAKRPEGEPRSVYVSRIKDQIINRSFFAIVKDLGFKSKPLRTMSLGTSDPYHLQVLNCNPSSSEYMLIERIDLKAADADERLSRYEFIQE